MGEQCPPLFLIIPNIAIAELSSMTFIVPVGTTEAQTKTVVSIFDEMGDTLITDEQHLAAGTTLASCGIAYAMRYIRALLSGAKDISLGSYVGLFSLTVSSLEQAQKASAATENKNNFFINLKN